MCVCACECVCVCLEAVYQHSSPNGGSVEAILYEYQNNIRMTSVIATLLKSIQVSISASYHNCNGFLQSDDIFQATRSIAPRCYKVVQ